MTVYHNHHITPKHLGGDNSPSNLVRVTVEQHAALHKQLWEDLGHIEDKIAWLALSGQITTAEAIIMAVKKANTGRKVVFSEEHKANLRKARAKQKPPRLGMKTSDETKSLMSIAQKKRFENPENKEYLKQRWTGENNPVYIQGPWNKGMKDGVRL